jgi:chemotaxis protein CheC
VNALSERQADALTELINIAFGLTAAKLSEISGSRVLLDVPIISIHSIQDLAKELGRFISGPAASVHQLFSGPIAGDAILILNYDGAVTLSNLVVEESLRAERLDSATSDVLTEVANMLLSACLGMFGNLLQEHVKFSIPMLHLESLEQFLTSLSVGSDDLRDAVVITTSFNIAAREVEGRIVIILGVSSLERLIQAADEWEGEQSLA